MLTRRRNPRAVRAIRITRSGVCYEILNHVPGSGRCSIVAARTVRRVCRGRSRTDTHRQAAELGMDPQLVVSHDASRGHWRRRRTGLVGGHLPIDHAGDVAAQAGGRRDVRGHIYVPLARVHTLLQGTAMGIRDLLYGVRERCCTKLVLGEA